MNRKRQQDLMSKRVEPDEECHYESKRVLTEAIPEEEKSSPMTKRVMFEEAKEAAPTDPSSEDESKTKDLIAQFDKVIAKTRGKNAKILDMVTRLVEEYNCGSSQTRQIYGRDAEME